MKRKILLVSLFHQELVTSIEFIEKQATAQVVQKYAENIDLLISLTLETEYDLVLVYADEHHKIDVVDMDLLVQSVSLPIILLLHNPTVNQTVDMMNAGVMGVADWSNQDRIIELIKRHLEIQVPSTTEPIYQNIVEYQTELICRYDRDLCLLFANRAYCEWQGLSSEDLIGTSFTEKISDADREQAIAHVKALSRDNPVAISVHSAILPDGTIQIIEWTDRAIFDASGEIQEYQGIGRDVSERERVAEALRKSEEQYRTLIESSESVIVVVDATGELFFANKITSKQLQLDVDEIIGNKLDNLFPQHIVDNQLRLIREVIRTGEGETYEAPVPMAGVVHWYRTSIQPIRNTSGTIDRVLVNAVDITPIKSVELSLRQSEEKFRSIYEQSPLAIQVYDGDANLTDVNQKTLEIYGITDKKYLLGYNFWSNPDLTEEQQLTLKDGRATTLSATLDFEIVKKTNLFPTDKTGILYFDIYVIPLMIEDETVGYLAQMVDVTERNRARTAQEEVNQHLERRVQDRTKALEQSKERIEAIFNHSADGILLLDADLKIQQGNYAFEQMFSASADIYFDKSLSSLMSDEDRLTISLQRKSIVERHETKRIEVQAERYDGTTFDAELSIAPINRSDKAVENIVCIVRDISERKQAETERKGHILEIEDLYNNAPSGYHSIDATGTFIRMNNTELAWLGYSHEEVINKFRLSDLLTPECFVRVQHKLPELIETGAISDLELELKRKDGTTMWVLGNATAVYDADGNFSHSRSTLHDITKQKVAESQLRYLASLQEFMHDSVIGIDLEFRVQSWNRASQDMFGWTSDEAKEQDLFDLLHFDFIDVTPAAVYREALSNNSWTGEVKARHRDGQQIYLLCSVGLLRDEHGELIGLIGVNHDITERKEYERQLKYHASLQESMGDAVFVTDMDFKIQSWNSAAEVIYGWTIYDAIGVHANDILQNELSENEHHQYFGQLMEHGQLTLDVIQHNKNGDAINIWCSMTLIKDERGNPTSILYVNHDITERKQAEIALRESEERYRLLVLNVTDMISRHTSDGTYTFATPSSKQITGYEPEELVDRSAYDFFHPEDIAAILKSHKSIIEMPSVYTVSYRFKRKDNQYRWVETTSHVVKDHDNDEINEIISVTRDISDRKEAEIALRESEERYERIVNLSEEAILVTDATARITYVNPTWSRLTGYSTEDTLGQEYFEFLIAENQEPARKRFEEKKAGKTFRLDTAMVRKDGNPFWVMVSSSPIMSPDGEFQGIMSMITDIDLRKKVEIALATSLETEREMQGYLTALHDISLTLAHTDTLDDFYHGVVEEALSKLGFERFALFLYDEEDEVGVGTYGTDIQGNINPEHEFRLKLDDLTGIIQRMLSRNERFAFDNEAQLYTNGKPNGIGQNAAVALWHDKLQGWLSIDNGITYEPISQLQLDILALYALTVSSQLASKQAELALKTSEEKYRIIANNIKDLIIRVDSQNNVIYASPSSYELLGYQPEELLEINGFDLIHPDDLEKVSEQMDLAMQSGPVGLRLEERLRHKNSAYIWVEVTANAIYKDENQPPTELVLSVRDISERKANELEITAITERLKLATSVGQIGIWFYDAGTRQLIWDEQMCAIYGIDSSEATPSISFWKTTIHPDDYEMAVAGLDTPVAEDEIYSAEYRILTQNGETRHIRVRAMGYLDRTGHHTGTIGVNIDITDLKLAEIALRDSEERFRQLINAAPLAIVVTDQHVKIRLVNEQAEKLFGYERSELIGQHVEILIPDSLHNQHTENRNTYMSDPHLRQMGAGTELYARRKDGSLFATEIQLSSVETSEGIMVMSYVIDITERKRVEAELERQRVFLQAVIDTSPSMIFVKDIDGRFIFVNPAMASFFDTSVDELMAKSDTDLNIPQREIDDFHDADSRVITQGETIFLEEPLTLSNGETHWLQTTKAPLVSENGQSIHVLGISTDITERKQAEIALQQALTKEKELGELKSIFVSTASHQFRTPLAAILASTETLTALRDRLNESQIDARLDRIRSQVIRMEGLMDDVLELSRIQANQIQYKPEQSDLNVLCQEVIRDFVHQEAYRDRIIYLGTESPLIFMFDTHLMHHIVNNIIHNALKYSKEQVYVDLSQTDHDIIFTVRDHGIGIPQEHLSNLFIPFSRAENVGSIAGTGLGLSIVKQSVEAHDGTIIVESETGVGTTFIVKIPYLVNEGTQHG